MTLSEAVKSVLSKYVDFSGRARRSEYWYWTLTVVLAEIVVLLIKYYVAATPGQVLYVLLVLAVLLPSLAVTVRRLHDTGRSGWWILIGLIPIIGAIVLIVFAVQDSAPETNEYGPSPKAIA